MKHIREIIHSHFLEPEQTEALNLLTSTPFVKDLDTALGQVQRGTAPETWSITSETVLRRVNSFLAQEQDTAKKRSLEEVVAKLIRCVLLDVVKQHPHKLPDIIAALKRECYRQQFDYQALATILSLDLLQEIAKEQMHEPEPLNRTVHAKTHSCLQWLRSPDQLQTLDCLLFEKQAIHHRSDFSALFTPNPAAILNWNPEHVEFMLVLLDKLWKGNKPAIASPPGSTALWEIVAKRCKTGEKAKTAKGLASQLSKLKSTERFEKHAHDVQEIINKASNPKTVSEEAVGR